MTRRRMFTVALTLLIALTIFERSAFSSSVRRIPGFHMIKDFPETMAAGSTYEAELMFLNPRGQTFWANITLEITKEQATTSFGDFSLEGTLYAYDAPPKEHSTLDIVFDEVNGGVFQFEGWVEERFDRLILTVSLSSNLMSSNYTFTLTVTLQ